MELPPAEGNPDLLIIAGEASGDEHAARMMKQVWQQEPALRVSIIGGQELKRLCAAQNESSARAQGQFLFDLTEHAVVGVAEVLKHYRFFRAFFYALVDWIAQHRPKAVLLIDYPGFNLRLAAELKKRAISSKGGGSVQILYYVSPQIWAWKRGRRFRMADTIDSLGCIFPFEVESYADTTLPVQFVGHPFTNFGYESPIHYDKAAPILLLPGSRATPVRRIFPFLMNAFARFAQRHPQVSAKVIVPNSSIQEIATEILESPRFDSIRKRVIIASNQERHQGSAVLMSSGTMSLTCALAGLPGAIVYRLNPISYFIGKCVVKIPYIGIANLLLDQPVYPEYIQNIDTCKLSKELESALQCKERIENTRLAAHQLKELLDSKPGSSVVDWLLKEMNN